MGVATPPPPSVWRKCAGFSHSPPPVRLISELSCREPRLIPGEHTHPLRLVGISGGACWRDAGQGFFKNFILFCAAGVKGLCCSSGGVCRSLADAAAVERGKRIRATARDQEAHC